MMVSLPQFEDGPPTEAGSGGGCGTCESNGGESSKCGNGLEKVYKNTAVRYGYMKHIGEFVHSDRFVFTCGAKVVIQTARGIEVGEQVSLGCSGCDRHVSREQIKTYIKNSGADSYQLEHGRILREATPDDLRENLRLRVEAREMLSRAQSLANEHLGRDRMNMVECEYLLGGERSIFYFVAEGRVDFRSLVRQLSQEFQTRIQMHQVGARDEARLLADFETCGREVCCKVFLKTLKPITMRMAKLQRATLDPSKVSGRCGRLKCCLRYEHESYESLDKQLPKKGEKVNTTHGYGVVVDRQIITQLVQIERYEETGRVTVVIEDVTERRLSSFPDIVKKEPLPVARVARSQPRRPARAKDSQGQQPKSERKEQEQTKPKKDNGGSVEKVDRQAATGGESTRPPKRRRRGRRRRKPGESTGGSGGGGTSGSGGNGHSESQED
jgi:cell fate regulator YaaT (PSP1 superfamily)